MTPKTVKIVRLFRTTFITLVCKNIVLPWTNTFRNKVLLHIYTRGYFSSFRCFYYFWMWISSMPIYLFWSNIRTSKVLSFVRTVTRLMCSSSDQLQKSCFCLDFDSLSNYIPWTINTIFGYAFPTLSHLK